MKVEAAALRIGFEQSLSGLDQAVLRETMSLRPRRASRIQCLVCFSFSLPVCIIITFTRSE